MMMMRASRSSVLKMSFCARLPSSRRSFHTWRTRSFIRFPGRRRGRTFSNKVEKETIGDVPSSTAVLPMTTTATSKVGLFVDVDNLLIPGTGALTLNETDIVDAVFRESETYGRVVVKRAYMDSVRYARLRNRFVRYGVEIVDMPTVTSYTKGKNGADIKLSVDAVSYALEGIRDIDTFIVVSGDSDFSTLVTKLREYNKKTVVMARPASTSEHLKSCCDVFRDIDKSILAKPVSRIELEPKVLGAIVLTGGHPHEEYVTARALKKFEGGLRGGASKDRVDLELVLHRSDASDFFEVKEGTSGEDTLVRIPADVNIFADSDFTLSNYEFFHCAKHLLSEKRSIDATMPPVVLGYAIQMVHDVLSNAEDGEIEYDKLVSTTRTRLREEMSVSMGPNQCKSFVRMLGFLRLIEPTDASEEEFNVTEQGPPRSYYDGGSWPSHGSVHRISVKVSDQIDHSDLASFRTHFDMNMIASIRELCGYDDDGSPNRPISTVLPITCDHAWYFLYGLEENVKGHSSDYKLKGGKTLEFVESEEITKYRVKRIWENEEVTTTPVVHADTTDTPEETTSLFDRIRRRFRQRIRSPGED